MPVVSWKREGGRSSRALAVERILRDSKKRRKGTLGVPRNSKKGMIGSQEISRDSTNGIIGSGGIPGDPKKGMKP